MNQAQLKYARERAEKLFRDRLLSLKVKHTVVAVALSTNEKYEALKTGAFTIDKAANRSGWNWADAVKFKGESAGYINTDKLDADVAKLTSTYRNLTDELILGDNEKALELLKAFEAA